VAGGAAVAAVALFLWEPPEAPEPEDAQGLYELAVEKRSIRSYKTYREAAGYLKRALGLRPDFPDATTELALVYLAQVENGIRTKKDAFREIRVLVGQVLGAHPGHVRARAIGLFVRAQVLFDAQDLEPLPDIANELYKLIDEAPGDVEVRRCQALVLEMLARYDEAAVLLEEAVALDPMNVNLLIDYSLALRHINDDEAAAHAFDRAYEAGTDHPIVHAGRGLWSRVNGDVVGFVRGYLRAVELDPEDHEYFTPLAMTLYSYGLANHAEKFWARAFAMAPNDAASRTVQLWRANNYENAEEAMRVAREIIQLDNNENRSAEWQLAIKTLFAWSAKSDSVPDAIAFVNDHSPGFFDASLPADIRVRSAQLMIVGELIGVVPKEELIHFADGINDFFESHGISPTQASPYYDVAQRLARGDDDGAIDVLLTVIFPKGITRQETLSVMLERDAYMQPILHDPRVQVAYAEFKKEKAENRESIRVLLENSDY
jgi:tetratricopeptide (TPR) repeat protein